MNSLVDEPVPGFAFRVLERDIAISTPFLEKHCARVLSEEIGPERFFKRPAENHGGPGLFLLPTIEIPDGDSYAGIERTG